MGLHRFRFTTALIMLAVAALACSVPEVASDGSNPVQSGGSDAITPSAAPSITEEPAAELPALIVSTSDEGTYGSGAGAIVLTANLASIYDYDIFLHAGDGSALLNLTDNPAVDLSPAPSPDGQRIAFISDRDDTGFGDVFIMNRDGSDPVNLTHTPGVFDSDPEWSPDGSQIFFGAVPGGVSNFYIMNADGSNLRPLTDDSLVKGRALWSPDGSRIVYSAGTYYGDYDIYVVNQDGSNQINLTQTPDRQELSPVWSPDGSRIAYLAGNDEYGARMRSLMVMNADGSGPVEVADDAFDGTRAAWSPDGTSLYYCSASADPSLFGQLVRIGADGQGKQPLTSGQSGIYEIQVSPDGNFLLYGTGPISPAQDPIGSLVVSTLDGSLVLPVTSLVLETFIYGTWLP
jgi:Tol biopolymer transport system component